MDAPMAHYFQGENFLAMKRYGEARQSVARAIALNPNFYRAHVVMGESLYKQRDFAAATDCFRKAVSIEENNLAELDEHERKDAAIHLALALHAQHRYLESEEVFRTKVVPFVSANYRDWSYQYGQTLLGVGKDDEAHGYFLAAARRRVHCSPPSAEALLFVAQEELKSHNPVESERLARLSLKSQADGNKYAWQCLQASLRAQGLEQEAQALQFDPEQDSSKVWGTFDLESSFEDD